MYDSCIIIRTKSGEPTDKLNLNVRVNLDLLEDAPKKKDGRGRPRKDRVADHYPLQQMAALPQYPVRVCAKFLTLF